ncbi:hypothetical protein [Helicobacter didelphidarum]|uniref:hypothetical protein n=1 Tax=Helicobacter didelphidarum TaxID=2040648 RepID=UPI001FE967C2|nr:hypothetical protein [Helicobacter didelphidarum]
MLKAIFLFSMFAFLHASAQDLEVKQYNRYKTWKNQETEEILKTHEKKLEIYYKQVDKQSKERNFVRFNGKKIISHTQFATMNLKELHGLHTYVILSEFYIQWVSPHNQLDGVSVGGILSDDAGEKKAQVRYFKFAQRYYSALHRLGIGAKAYSYCAAPYLTSCILIGIGEKW